jgi:molybdopterin molybdotransferase
VLARALPLDAEDVPVARVAGRVAAEAATARTDLPPFDSSAMDGYAVRSVDTPGPLTVVGHSAAGKPELRVLGAGEAIVISTGAVVPAGADAVVPVERTSGDVEVEGVAPGENIRPRGGDARVGDVVAERGDVLRPAQVGALAAAGVASVRCTRRPRVAVFATGSELRAPGEVLELGQIYESNTVMLTAQLESAGAEVTVLDPVRDDEDATRVALERGLAGDMLITSGGVSVGPHDLVRAALAALGAEEIFWRVAVKPGKPIAFAVRGATLVFGLPGNPVSSLVGFELFVRPALLAMQGASTIHRPRAPVQLPRGYKKPAGRAHYLRARLARDGEKLVAYVHPKQGSAMLSSTIGCTALVEIAAELADVPAGALAPAILLEAL